MGVGLVFSYGLSTCIIIGKSHHPRSGRGPRYWVSYTYYSSRMQWCRTPDMGTPRAGPGTGSTCMI
jgi:hypothetical protein